MARIPPTRSMKPEFDASTTSSSGMSGLLKLKPSRARERKSWMPLDLGAFRGMADENDPFFAGIDRDNLIFDESVRSSPLSYNSPTLAPSQPNTEQSQRTTINLAECHVSPVNTQSPELRGSAGSFKPANPLPLSGASDQSKAEDEITKVFGQRLPDPIFLSQWPGENNGEIKFIQHPNRDVSAHEWDTNSYQWVNIGQYSALRRKIEGQLANDRLRGQTISSSIPPNTLAYFRAVSKQREVAAREAPARNDPYVMTHTMPRIHPVVPRPKLQILPGLLHSLDQFGSLSTISGGETGLPTRNTYGLPGVHSSRMSMPPVEPIQPVNTSVREKAREEHSGLGTDDPFVSKSTQFPDFLRRSAPETSKVGTMNLQYQFPRDQSEARESVPSFTKSARDRTKLPFSEDTPEWLDDESLQAEWDQWKKSRTAELAGLREELKVPKTTHPESRSLVQSILNALESRDPTLASRYPREGAADQGLTENRFATQSSGVQASQRTGTPPSALPSRATMPLKSHAERIPVDTQTLDQSVPDGPRYFETNAGMGSNHKEPPTPQKFNTFALKEDCSPSSNLDRSRQLDEWWRSEGFNSSDFKDGDHSSGAINDRTLMRVYANLEAYITQPQDYFSRFTAPKEEWMDQTEEGKKSYFGGSRGFSALGNGFQFLRPSFGDISQTTTWRGGWNMDAPEWGAAYRADQSRY